MSEMNQDRSQTKKNYFLNQDIEDKQQQHQSSEISDKEKDDVTNVEDVEESITPRRRTPSQVEPTKVARDNLSEDVSPKGSIGKSESISVWRKLLNKYNEISNTRSYRWSVRVLWIVVILLVIMPAIGYIIFLRGVQNLNSSVLPPTSTSLNLYSDSYKSDTLQVSKACHKNLPLRGLSGELLYSSIALSPVTYVSQVSTVEGTDQKSPLASDSIKAAISMAVLDSLRAAQGGVETYIDQEFDEWIDTLSREKIDPFLEGYVNWFNTKLRNDLNLVKFLTGTSASEIAQQRIEEFTRQFSEQVISPDEVQEVAYRITEDTFEHYIGRLKPLLLKVKDDYKVSDEDWNMYLNQLAFNVPQFNEVGAEVDLTPNTTLKDIVALGGVALAAKFNPFVVKYGTVAFVRVMEKSIAALGIKAAAKLGTFAVAETIAKTINPALAVTIVAWDLADASAQSTEEKIGLRENILAGFESLRHSLTYGDNSGVGIVVLIEELQDKIRGKIIDSLLSKT